MSHPALDPRNSVVVEACAGSGKTWLLASRLIRLLLAGVAPSKILAITYTRKAAAEIEARVFEWLRFLARSDDEAAMAFLVERGLDLAASRERLACARGLFEQVLLADQPITITTFHGWFVRLVQAAPLDAGLAGYALADSAEPLLEEAWARIARTAAQKPDSQIAAMLLELFREPGFFNAREMLGKFIARRAEWQAMGMDVDQVLSDLRLMLGVSETPCAAAEFFARPGLVDSLQTFAQLLRDNGTQTDLGFARQLCAALESGDDKARLFGCMGVFLTNTGTLRARKMSKTLMSRLGAENAERYFDLHTSLGGQFEALNDALVEEAAYALNRAALHVGVALGAALETHKQSRRVMDFTDLEVLADRLLSSEHAAFLQARLDARYEQILLDEFQDTNPLQWRILRAWFDAYGPGEDKPRVFLVGDPKQSIYRFRRAEPRIFGAAADYLREHFDARVIHNDTTRRNAPAVVQVVNAIFQPVGFREQFAHHAGLAGRVALMPLVGRGADVASEAQESDEADALRDPLSMPRAIAEDARRAGEAALIASSIRQWVGRLAIEDEGRLRAARFGDFMLLVRGRRHLAQYERALRQAHVPYLSASRGGLLVTLEAQDLSALLGFLASPSDDLKLAHALRSPVFALSDEALIALSRSGEGHWWQRLSTRVAAGGAEPAVVRAQALLARWLALAGQVPVHDVLSAIYTEADVLARYRASVPELMWPAVRANLEAFIRLSLEQGGGRYPSLVRFNDELKRLRDASDEAPDEGMIEGGEDGGRVRILTIHAAKGLEAPLVWLVDADSVNGGGEGFDVLLDWPPQADAPTHFSVFGNKGSRGKRRGYLFEQEAAAAAREELNLLYVAITRARQYVVASGIEPLRGSGGASFYRRIGEALASLNGDPAALAFGPEWPMVEGGDVPQIKTTPTLPRRHKLAVGKPRPQDSIGQRYGTALHHALECLTQGLPLPADCDEGVIGHATRILETPALSAFFDPAKFHSARNEIEFVLPDGVSGRIDRLVDTGDALWVLDYKAGRQEDAPMAMYRAQLERYRQAVLQLHPARGVRCALIFGDGALCEMV